jgi:DNA polymerase III delta prime subunit
MTIQSLYDSGRFPHALLIIGGQAEDIRRVIALQECDPADAVYVRESMPDGKYKIGELRETIAKGSRRPQFGDTRVFVFSDFDSMIGHSGVQCQNSLLKFLEEPQDYNRFVLTAASKSGILETILSRVVVVNADNAPDSDSADSSAGDSGSADSADSEIASAIVAALKNRDKAASEYNTAAAFARIKDRQQLGAVLQRLLHDFAAIMPNARKPEKVINATDVLQKYLGRLEINPNLSITVTSCAAELHTALHS